MNHGTRSMYNNRKCRCEPCKAASRIYHQERWQNRHAWEPLHTIGESKHLVEELAVRYGSIRKAGRAYDERYDRRPRTGERLLTRLRHTENGHVYFATLDRLEVLLWS